MRLFGFDSPEQFRSAHRVWVPASLDKVNTQRHPQWTVSIAVGQPDYLQWLKQELGQRGRRKQMSGGDDVYCLRDKAALYSTTLGGKN